MGSNENTVCVASRGSAVAPGVRQFEHTALGSFFSVCLIAVNLLCVKMVKAAVWLQC